MQFCETCGKEIKQGEIIYVLFKGAEDYNYTRFCKRCGNAIHSLFLANIVNMKTELSKK